MPSSIPFAIALPLAVLIANGASAQDAPADRCTGTLCDLYYGGAPAEPQPGQPAKQAAPKPLMAPRGGILGYFSGGGGTQATAPGAAPAARPLVGVGGGGLASMVRGEKQERCTGSLCDLYYGGPPPETPTEAPAGQTAAVAPDESIEPPAPDVAPQTTRRRRSRAAETEAGVRYEQPRCAATGRDPWQCYR